MSLTPEYIPEELDERELAMLSQCILYSKKPCGLPGHALMVLLAKYANAYAALVAEQNNGGHKSN